MGRSPRAKHGLTALICFSLALIIAVSMLPVGIIGSFALTDSDESSETELPEYDPSVNMTAEELKQTIEDLKNSLNDVDAQKDELYLQLEEALANKDNLESKYMAQKLEADAEIRLIEIRLDIFQEIVDNYDMLIENKRAEVFAIEESYKKAYDRFADRLRQSYEEGTPSTLEIFLNSDSFIEMLTSIERMKDVLEYDNELMADLEVIKRAHLAEQQELEVYLDQQKQVVAELEDGKRVLEEKVDESLKILDLQQENVDEYLHLLEIAEQNWAIMNEMIDQAVRDYYEQLEKEEQAEYKLTEEYKRIYVQPGILQAMEDGSICKGAEYYEDGEEYIWPLPMKNYLKWVITSKYGNRTYTNSAGDKVSNFHKGYDLGSAHNTEIYAVKSGTVITAKWDDSYGYYAVVLHEDNTRSLYAHCSKLLVKTGEFVLQGENIALVGSTGTSTGYHLHIEMRIGNQHQDPSLYITMPTSNKRED